MNQKLLFIASFSIFFLIIIYFTVVGLSRNTTTQVFTFPPTPTPVNVYLQKHHSTSSQNYQFTPFQKTSIGNTTDDEVATMSSNTQQQADETIYTVAGVNPVDPDIIITQNKKVIYEKTSLFTTNPGGFPPLQPFIDRFGPADKVIDFNRYTQSASTYLYATKGFVLVANPVTGLVYEIERFTPMSVSEYLTRFGQHIQPASQGVSST